MAGRRRWEQGRREVRRTSADRGGYLTDQLVALSRIVRRKYRSVKIALCMFGGAACCWTRTGVLGAVLRRAGGKGSRSGSKDRTPSAPRARGLKIA